MESTFVNVDYLTKSEIILINRKMTLHFGGLFLPPDNIKNHNPLDYLIEAVQTEMYGVELYPSISKKAAIYLHNIICNHIFHDGTKRTGLESALLFLEKNNFALKSEVTDEELISLAIEIANGQKDIASITEWFSIRIIRKQ